MARLIRIRMHQKQSDLNVHFMQVNLSNSQTDASSKTFVITIMGLVMY